MDRTVCFPLHYQATEMDERKRVATVNEALCEGCGACSVTCQSKTMQQKNWTPRQFLEMIDAAAR